MVPALRPPANSCEKERDSCVKGVAFLCVRISILYSHLPASLE